MTSRDEIAALVSREVERAAIREKRLLTVRDVAELIGLSERTVRELIARGEIPTRKVEPYNRVLVSRPDLDEWVSSLPRAERVSA